MPKKRIGVIGCGQWGPNQIRAFFFHPGTQVTRICDKDAKRLESVSALYPGVQTTRRWQDITQDSDIDAVVIATPVSTHFDIAKDALSHGKDVLCEKPLTIKVEQSEELTKLAKEMGRILMVGHVFLYNAGILKLKEIIDSKECGDSYYAHAQRTNLGPVRQDVNAVYDLASHDISIFNFLLGGSPKVLSATGKCYVQKGIEDVAFLALEYPGNIMAHIHVSWLDPKKIRDITIVGNKKMVTWNDMATTGPVEIFAKHLEYSPYYKDFGEFQVLVKEGETLTPHVKTVEPVRQQADHFVECLISRKNPLSDGNSATAVVKTLEDIEKILAKQR